MKIFEIIHEDGNKEWCTGESNIEALANYVSTTECILHDMGTAEIIEVPLEKWDEYFSIDEHGNKTYFTEWMKENGGLLPDIICGTMYLGNHEIE